MIGSSLLAGLAGGMVSSHVTEPFMNGFVEDVEMNCTFCSQVQRWIKQPFKPEGSVLNWALFILLVMVIVFFWSRILVRIAP